jgi:hypothetical protein
MDTKTDTPLTLTTIQAFRQMLDIMEEFIRNTEAEHLETKEQPENPQI